MVSKIDFLNYEEARLSGEYNMVMDAHQVMHDYGISKDDYWDIIRNYDTYYKKWIGSHYTS